MYDRVFRHSVRMRAVEQMLLKAVVGEDPVFVTGETGTGKELIADLAHALSPRANGPWVKVRCSALPGERLESELFGDELRAIDGGNSVRRGRLELAAGGTLCLDEIADLPLALQNKLLGFLHEGRFMRNGGRVPVAADVRLVITTNRDLRAMTTAGLFREDLYYRLNVITIPVPPLRERREEIPSLVEHFRAEFCRRLERDCPPFSPETVDLMLHYRWPGNVRELENVVKRYVVLGDERYVEQELRGRLEPASAVFAAWPPAEGLRGIAQRAARKAERALIEETLDRVGGNRAEAARRLKVSYKTFLKKLQEVGVAGARRHGGV
ncbi:MAG: sigma-54-dependent Fis family transcriptional regulator [Candidatus Rokubacteria bacterium]|nr:sigma-54-dependent Fis family transcriptional regulator [Candidatus Rokubacteria bacterium]